MVHPSVLGVCQMDQMGYSTLAHQRDLPALPEVYLALKHQYQRHLFLNIIGCPRLLLA